MELTDCDLNTTAICPMNLPPEFLSEYSAFNLFKIVHLVQWHVIMNISVFLDVTSHFCLLSDSSALITSEGKLAIYANRPLG